MEVSCQLHATFVSTDKEPVDPQYPSDQRIGGPRSPSSTKDGRSCPFLLKCGSLAHRRSLHLLWVIMAHYHIAFPNVLRLFCHFYTTLVLVFIYCRKMYAATQHTAQQMHMPEIRRLFSCLVLYSRQRKITKGKVIDPNTPRGTFSLSCSTFRRPSITSYIVKNYTSASRIGVRVITSQICTKIKNFRRLKMKTKHY